MLLFFVIVNFFLYYLYLMIEIRPYFYEIKLIIQKFFYDLFYVYLYYLVRVIKNDNKIKTNGLILNKSLMSFVYFKLK